MEIRVDQTSPGPTQSRGVTIAIVPVMPIAMIFAIGTGGCFSSEVVRARQANSFAHECRKCAAEPTGRTDLLADIDLIQDALKMSVTQLAQHLGVTRQAIYGWKSGSAIKAENASKLTPLAEAAQTVASANIELTPLSLKRKLPGGLTLLESIGKGGDGKIEALRLLKMLENEDAKRQMLSNRFKDRRRSFADSIDAAPRDQET